MAIWDELLPMTSQFHGRVLDAGCGNGTYSARIREILAVEDVVSCDVQPLPEAYGVKFTDINPERQFVLADIQNLTEFKDGEFDCTMAWHVIEHVISPDQALRELARVTRDLLMIALPTANEGAWLSPGHIHWWTAEEFREFLAKAEDFNFVGYIKDSTGSQNWLLKRCGGDQCSSLTLPFLPEQTDVPAADISAFVLAAGDGSRFKSAFPKSFLEIEDEALIYRLLRQLGERGIVPTVITHQPELKEVVPRWFDPEEGRRWIAESFWSSRRLWKGRKIIEFHGDVWFTDRAIDIILKDQSPLAIFGKRPDEMFALSIMDKVGVLRSLGRIIKLARDRNQARLFEMYRLYYGLRLGEPNFNEYYIDFEDATMDFDYDEQFDRARHNCISERRRELKCQNCRS